MTIENFWSKSQFHLAIIFDKLIRRELIQIRTMSNYLIEKLTNKGVTLENNSVRAV